jgi:hypothetical protein
MELPQYMNAALAVVALYRRQREGQSMRVVLVMRVRLGTPM